MKASTKNIFYDIGVVTISSVLFSVAVNMFIIPGNIILGGATGIGTVLNRLFGIPTGMTILTLNAPLLLINVKLYGLKFLSKTIVGTVATSFATDFFDIFPVISRNQLLCALFGGVALGIGTGLLFKRGYTTGGTDLIAWAIKGRWNKLSDGYIIMIADLSVIVLLVLLSREYAGIIYSMISVLTFSLVLDLILKN